MPRELKDVNVEFISLVNKGANKQPITIYKSADVEIGADGQPVIKTEVQVPEVIKKEEGLLEKIIKSVTSVIKGDKSFEQRMQDAIAQSNIWRAVDVLQSAIYDIYYGWESTDTPLADIGKLIDEFKAFYLANLQTLGVTKAAEQMKQSIDERTAIQKSADKGKKVSITNDQAQQVQKCIDGLNQILKFDRAETAVEKGVGDMDAKELQEVLAPVVKAVEDLSGKVDTMATKVETLEKTAVKTEDVQKTEAQVKEVKAEVQKSAEELIKESVSQLVDLVKSVDGKVEGLGSRIGKMEETAGVPNGDTEVDVTKSAVVKKSDGVFGNMLNFGK